MHSTLPPSMTTPPARSRPTAKVLVKSRYRNPTVKVGHDFSRGPSGEIVIHTYLHQFTDYHCWMTPEEAAFVIDSEENMKYIASEGVGLYYYPAGAAMPMPVDFDGPFTESTLDRNLLTNDPAQSKAARELLEQAERALAAREAAEAPSATE